MGFFTERGGRGWVSVLNFVFSKGQWYVCRAGRLVASQGCLPENLQNLRICYVVIQRRVLRLQVELRLLISCPSHKEIILH